ncbi:MAG: hypothetical protein AAGF12_27625, partial [Myxococcota bacterium]
DDLLDDEARFIDESQVTAVVGASVEVGRPVLRGRAEFRQLTESAGLVSRRGGVRLTSQPVEPLLLSAQSAFDLTDGTWIDGVVEVAVRPVESLRLSARAERHVPRFDFGSIWAYFDVAPVTEGRLGASFAPTTTSEVGAALRARHADLDDANLSGTDSENVADFADEFDYGVEGFARFRALGFRVNLSASAWGGDLGPTASVLLDLRRPILRWLSAELRATVWHFADPLRENLYGVSISEAVGLRVRLSRSADIRGDLQHAFSRSVGHRVRGLLSLSIEVWR